MLNTVHSSRSAFKETAGAAAAGHSQHASNDRVRRAHDRRTVTSWWFGAPTDDQDRRPQLTRERVVEEALAVIAHDGAQALTMRRLAGRLGVVPGALYHHVRNKQQLQDLLLDGVLAEVDLDLDPPRAGPSSSRSWPTGYARC